MSSYKYWNILIVLVCVLMSDFYQVFQNCFMADKKRKIEEIVSDLKTNSEKN